MYCPGCPLFKTKPGQVSVAIQQMLAWAVRHDKRQKGGLRINDTDKMSPLQWAAWEGLSDGRSNYEGEAQKKRQQQHTPVAPQAPPLPRRH